MRQSYSYETSLSPRILDWGSHSFLTHLRFKGKLRGSIGELVWFCLGKWSIKSSILIVFMAMATFIWGWSANAGNSVTIEEEDKEEEKDKAEEYSKFISDISKDTEIN